MRSRVLLVSPELHHKGGVSSYCRNSLPHLEGVDVFTVGARVNERVGSLGTAARMLLDYARFARRLASRRYGLVHLNPSLGYRALLRDGLLLLMAKALACKVLVFLHGWDHNCEAQIRSKYLRMFRAVFFRADALIVLAKEFETSLRDMGYAGTIHVETTNVDKALFDNPAYCRDYSRSSRILFLSRIERDKGVFEALDAFRLLGRPDARLVVAGDGSALAEAQQYAETTGIPNVTFSGYVTGSAKDRAFLEADVFLFPTAYGEGLPIAVLEAMAYGLPVITRPVGGLKDFFEDGTMGRMTAGRDPHELAQLLASVLTPDVASRIGPFNRRYARDRFGADKTAKRLQAIYATLA